MATFPTENPITGSPLIGSPISVTVIPVQHQTAWTFHRVMLRVYAALVVPDTSDPNYPSDAGYTELEFSQPVASSSAVQMNIESALQAVCDRYQPAAMPPTQNAYVKFRIEAWDEWMVDGTVHQTDPVLLPGEFDEIVAGSNLFTGLTDGAGWTTYNSTTETIGGGTVTADGSGGLQGDDEYLMSNIISWDNDGECILRVCLDSSDGELPESITIAHQLASQSGIGTDQEMPLISTDGNRGMYQKTMNISGTWGGRIAFKTTRRIYSPYVAKLGSIVTHNLYYYAFQGAFSDFERLVNNGDNRAAIDRWTRKPQTVPEVVFCGEEYVRPADWHGTLGFDHASETVPQYIISGAPEGGPKSQAYEVTADGLKPVDSSIIIPFSEMNVYAIQKPADGYVLRFRNLLGCHESLHLRCLPKNTVPINTEKYVISRQETFGHFSRGLAVKSGDREEWRMSSGPLDEAWASWYVHEFLKAEACWVKAVAPNDSVVWLPVHVIPEETVTLVDREKTNPYEIQFTLQMDIEGSPMSALAI